jgi:hypothetical protein
MVHVAVVVFVVNTYAFNQYLCYESTYPAAVLFLAMKTIPFATLLKIHC